LGGEGEGRVAKSEPKLWTSQRAQRFAECKEITRTKRRGGITVRTKRGAKRLDCQKSIAREGPKGRKSCVGGRPCPSRHGPHVSLETSPVWKQIPAVGV